MLLADPTRLVDLPLVSGLLLALFPIGLVIFVLTLGLRVALLPGGLPWLRRLLVDVGSRVLLRRFLILRLLVLGHLLAVLWPARLWHVDLLCF